MNEKVKSAVEMLKQEYSKREILTVLQSDYGIQLGTAKTIYMKAAKYVLTEYYRVVNR